MRRVKPLDRRIGKCLRKLRQEAGLSQVALAKNSGVTYQQIQKYEAGTNRIAVSTLYRIAPALDYHVQGFLAALELRFK